MEEIKSSIRTSLSSSGNVFSNLLDRFKVYYERPCGNISELKRRSTKGKGDIFEVFSVLYLQALGYEAWLLKDLPQELLEELSLKRFDVGIDIVARKDEEYYAVQSKYRVKNRSKPVTALGWGQLSTFYSVCMRTGPWKKYIVITNCDYIRRMGRKNYKDKSIVLKTLMDTKRELWLNIIGSVGHKLVDEENEGKHEEQKEEKSEVKTGVKKEDKKEKLSLAEVRNKRLAYLGIL